MSKREIILPSSFLVSDENVQSNLATYKIGSNVYSSVVGLFERSEDSGVRVVTLRGKYYPQVGDEVIGIITKDSIFSWSVDINSFVEAILPVSYAIKKKRRSFSGSITKLLTINDIVYAQIVDFDRFNPPILTLRKKGLGKITSGYLITITPGKIPRVIGKNHSMIKMIKEKLDLNLIVGKNGRIVALTNDFQKIKILEEVIQKIDNEAHVPGLTDRVKNLLESKISK
ncbi:MAG TPA: exosome complex RNA-binding protein Rrp4 [Geobacterales bacterium]|nr:exosome complex RNA-binding protein Rrp4 [Geobacterales bacterium]